MDISPLWRCTKVIPIPKPGQPSFHSCSHRPISLLITLSKLLERGVAHRLNYFIHQNHILPPEQFGFRKQHSPVNSQLRRIADCITHGFYLIKHTGMFLLDTEKVWLNGLLFRLISFHLPDYLTFFLDSYLEGRTSAVHLNYSTSALKPTHSGLPQGAVLSTTLFSLYLSDMPHPSPTPLALLSQSWRPDTVSCRLSHAVTTLFKYFSTCKLRLNTHKTEAFLFSKHRPPSRTLLISMTPWTLVFGSALFRPCAGLKISDTQHLHTDANKAKTVLCYVYPLLARNSTLTQSSKLTLQITHSIHSKFRRLCLQFHMSLHLPQTSS